MPTLLLMRHAKSDWGDPATEDHDRPLNERGKRDAPRMGRLLAERGMQPAFIVTSSARRAVKSVKRLTRELDCDVYVEVRRELYLASVEQWLQVLSEVPADADSVLGVGHNPGLEELIARMTGEAHRMPTAAIAHLAVEGAWAELPRHPCGTLRELWRPKELPEEPERD